jgi:hypothetical protein
LKTTYFRSFVSSLVWFSILNSDYVYARKRLVESFEREVKMSREKERSKEKKYMCMEKKNRKKETKRKGKKDMKRD